jgi:hypothetical protein
LKTMRSDSIPRREERRSVLFGAVSGLLLAAVSISMAQLSSPPGRDSFESVPGILPTWPAGSVISGTQGWSFPATMKVEVNRGEASDGVQCLSISGTAGALVQSAAPFGTVQFREVRLSMPAGRVLAPGVVPAWPAAEAQLQLGGLAFIVAKDQNLPTAGISTTGPPHLTEARAGVPSAAPWNSTTRA